MHDGVMRQGTKYETTSVGQVKQNLHTVLTVKCIWNVSTSNISAVASEAYHDWSGEAAGARLRVNFMLNYC